jgi:hypothetical protein
MGRAGRRIVEDRFSWVAAGRATLALYERLLPPGRTQLV